MLRPDAGPAGADERHVVAAPRRSARSRPTPRRRTHKLIFFRNGATPNLVVTGIVPPAGQSLQDWAEQFREKNEGVYNAYKTLFFSSGVDAKVVGSDLEQISFKETQGAGETRLAAAAGVPPGRRRLSEGLAGSSLNAGNYAAGHAEVRRPDRASLVGRRLRLAGDHRPAVRRAPSCSTTTATSRRSRTTSRTPPRSRCSTRRRSASSSTAGSSPTPSSRPIVRRRLEAPEHSGAERPAPGPPTRQPKPRAGPAGPRPEAATTRPHRRRAGRTRGR